MTETELIDQLREAIVLDGPDAWRSNGYLQDAQAAGLSLSDALRRAGEVSQEVANNSLLFENIRARIVRLAQPSRSHLIEQDLNQIIHAARSLNLSPDFVRNRWVPTVLKRLSGSAVPSSAEPIVPPASPAPVPAGSAATPPPETFADLLDNEAEPVPAAPEVHRPAFAPQPSVQPVGSVPEPFSPVTANPVSASRVTQPVEGTEPSRLPEPPPVVRKFTATPARVRQGQNVTLEWEVENLLAVTIDDLGPGLSPQNRGWVKPTKTTEYTLFDANDNPLSTVRVEVIPRDRSGVYGVLFALALLALIYWFIRNNNAQPESSPKSRRQTERSTGRRTQTTGVSQQQPEVDEPVSEAGDPPTANPDPPTAAAQEPGGNKAEPVSPPIEKEAAPTESVATPADARAGKYEEAFGDKPYDKVELAGDERGWRRARSNGRWGFVDENDQWVIEPQYEAVTPFRGNTAGAFQNGQLVTINRDGERVRN